MTCPKCNGSEMWDNRGTEKTPKSPQYKCKDKDCGHAIWVSATPKTAAPPKQDGGRAPRWTGAQLGQLYGWAFNVAAAEVVTFAKAHKVAFTVAEVVQATATLFISAGSHTAPTPKAAPLTEPPPQLQDDSDSLPF